MVPHKRFMLFKKWCEHYRKLLGIMNWDFKYKHELLDEDNQASVNTNYVGKMATIWLNKKYSLRQSDLRNTALHEIIHVFLAESICISSSRFITQEELDSQHEKDVIHLTRVIRELERRT